MNKTVTSSNRSKRTTPQKSKAATLPRLSKSELAPRENFSEYHNSSSRNLSTLWVIVVAFLILATLSFAVWCIFSGRADQTIRGDNFKQFQSKL